MGISDRALGVYSIKKYFIPFTAPQIYSAQTTSCPSNLCADVAFVLIIHAFFDRVRSVSSFRHVSILYFYRTNYRSQSRLKHAVAIQGARWIP